MDAQAEFVDVIDNLYASIVEEPKWVEALKGLTRLVGGNAAFHLCSDPRTATIVETHDFNADPEMVRLFKLHYASKDIRVHAGLKYPAGELLLDYNLFDLSQLRKSEIYNELLVPFDVPYLMGVWLKKAPTSFSSLSVENSLKGGPFQGAAVEHFRRIIPHLMRVAQARDLLARARLNQCFYRQVLDTLPFGLMLLNERGAMIEATPMAAEILREGITLSYRHSNIRALNAEDDQKLQVAIGAVGRLGVPGAGGETLSLRRITHALPLTVMVLPVITPELLMMMPRPACLLLLLDPERKMRAKVSLIRHALNLTHAEATLALTLFHGLALHEAAAHLGRSYNTCKTQMKAIYAKTGCDSQMDLIKKMMLVSFVPGGAEPGITP